MISRRIGYLLLIRSVIYISIYNLSIYNLNQFWGVLIPIIGKCLLDWLSKASSHSCQTANLSFSIVVKLSLFQHYIKTTVMQKTKFTSWVRCHMCLRHAYCSCFLSRSTVRLHIRGNNEIVIWISFILWYKVSVRLEMDISNIWWRFHPFYTASKFPANFFFKKQIK